MGKYTTSSLQLRTLPSRRVLLWMLFVVVVGYHVALSLVLYIYPVYHKSKIHSTLSTVPPMVTTIKKTDMVAGSTRKVLRNSVFPQKQTRTRGQAKVTVTHTQNPTFRSPESTAPARVTTTATKTDMAAVSPISRNLVFLRNHTKRQAPVTVTQTYNSSLGLQDNSRKHSLQVIQSYLREQKDLCEKEWEGKKLPIGPKPLCDCLPKTLSGVHSVNLNPIPLEETVAKNTEVLPGGHWEPKMCTARYKVVIVVPFRDRQQHLSVLLRYLHPILQAQQINYTIIVVEQHLPKVFNKAVMMNVGYRYAVMKHNADCIIFHDVDFIPEDGHHLYRCRDKPVHLGAFYDANHYRVNYTRSFGGATAFRPAEFEKLNGFSNLYFGWGGEDDDMWMRIQDKKLGILRNPREVAGYKVLRHKRDKGNIQLNRKDMIWRLFHDRHPKEDGLNNLQYVLKDMRLYPLYTWLLVNVGAEKL